MPEVRIGLYDAQSVCSSDRICTIMRLCLYYRRLRKPFFICPSTLIHSREAVLPVLFGSSHISRARFFENAMSCQQFQGHVKIWKNLLFTNMRSCTDQYRLIAAASSGFLECMRFYCVGLLKTLQKTICDYVHWVGELISSEGTILPEDKRSECCYCAAKLTLFSLKARFIFIPYFCMII